jgi:hypothetical protein
MVDRLEKLVAEAKKHITEISPTEAAAKMKSGPGRFAFSCKSIYVSCSFSSKADVAKWQTQRT